jgi:MYXO-CTERM domain-containing protein
VWVLTLQLPAGLGGRNLTIGATFDGADIVAPRTIPIATDAWSADYPPSARGGCDVAPGGAHTGALSVLVLSALAAFAALRQRR